MEHIVQFAIGIDDEGIKRAIAQNAEKTITQQLQRDVEKIIFDKNPWGTRNGLTAWTEKMFREFLEMHKGEIIEAASKELANKLVKTKMVKEMVQAEISKTEE